MAPMTTDGWSSYNAQSIPPTIVDGALAVTYPTETGQGYNNGIWRRLSVNVENECYFCRKIAVNYVCNYKKNDPQYGISR